MGPLTLYLHTRMSVFNRYAKEPKTTCGSSRDWIVFEEDFRVYAGNANVLDILLGNRPRPDGDNDQAVEAQSSWDSDHYALLNVLRGCLKGNIKRSYISPNDSASQIWLLHRRPDARAAGAGARRADGPGTLLLGRSGALRPARRSLALRSELSRHL